MILCYIEAGADSCMGLCVLYNLEVDDFKVQPVATTNYNRPQYSFRTIVTTYVHITSNTF